MFHCSDLFNSMTRKKCIAVHFCIPTNWTNINKSVFLFNGTRQKIEVYKHLTCNCSTYSIQNCFDVATKEIPVFVVSLEISDYVEKPPSCNRVGPGPLLLTLGAESLGHGLNDVIFQLCFVDYRTDYRCSICSTDWSGASVFYLENSFQGNGQSKWHFQINIWASQRATLP